MFKRFFQPLFELTERFTRHEMFSTEILMGLFVRFSNLCVDDQFTLNRSSHAITYEQCRSLCANARAAASAELGSDSNASSEHNDVRQELSLFPLADRGPIIDDVIDAERGNRPLALL